MAKRKRVRKRRRPVPESEEADENEEEELDDAPDDSVDEDLEDDDDIEDDDEDIDDEADDPDGSDDDHDDDDFEDEDEYVPEQTAGFSQTIMIFMFLMTIVIILDPSMRKAAGTAMGGILEPTIGFNGNYPIMTLLCASLIMVGFSSVLRHFFTDWVKMARSQKVMSSFQKEMRAARLSGNQSRIKKLMEVQGDIMKHQSEVMMSSMKTMVFTTIVAISIFTWLFTFFQSIDYRYVSVPWAHKVYMMENPYLLPNWVLLYSLISIPLGQVWIRTLKLWQFGFRSRKL